MLGNLKDSVTWEFYKVRAERKFREVAVQICEGGLDPERLEYLASNNIPLTRVLEMTGRTMPGPVALDQLHPAVQYLANLTDKQVKDLLRPVLPKHVSVLDAHPLYTKGLVQDLKRLLIASS